MKLFVKALSKNGDCFQYSCHSFPDLSMEKLKNGVFDGPQIRKLMKDKNFSYSMNMDELTAWFAFAEVLENILGNHKTENYKKTVGNMLERLKHFQVNINMEIHFLHSHLDCFPEKLENVNDEEGQRLTKI